MYFYNYWCCCTLGYVNNFGEDPQYAVAIYRMIGQFGIGFTGLLALVIPTDIHLMILSLMFVVFVPLHLIITCLSSVQSTLNDVLEKIS